MNEEFYQQVEWSDIGTIDQKVQALYNIVNWVSKQMSVGRVPENRQELLNKINLLDMDLRNPLSIAFIKMVQNGEIDEVTASEAIQLFLPWDANSTYTIGDMRVYEGLLYKCLQSHVGQEGWEPINTPALWKVCGVTEDGTPIWSQPISASDAYMIGDIVSYNGVKYKSLIDNNVWDPDTYPAGWEVIE